MKKEIENINPESLKKPDSVLKLIFNHFPNKAGNFACSHDGGISHGYREFIKNE